MFGLGNPRKWFGGFRVRETTNERAVIDNNSSIVFEIMNQFKSKGKLWMKYFLLFFHVENKLIKIIHERFLSVGRRWNFHLDILVLAFFFFFYKTIIKNFMTMIELLHEQFLSNILIHALKIT